jgi:hypothetical protein
VANLRSIIKNNQTSMYIKFSIQFPHENGHPPPPTPHFKNHTCFKQLNTCLKSAAHTLANLHVRLLGEGTAVTQWLRHCATNQKVAGSIPDGVIEFFSLTLILLGSTQPLTEMSNRIISWG